MKFLSCLKIRVISCIFALLNAGVMSDLIYGRNAVVEAIQSGKQVEKVFVLSTLRGEYEVQLRHLCTEHTIQLARVPEVKLKELAKGKAHQGVVAFMSPISYVDYHDVAALAFERGEIPLFVVADGVTDVRNIGAMSRSAHYFGAHGLIITGNFSGRIHEDTVKASAGALLQLPVSRVASLTQLISELQAMGIKVVATSLKSGLQPSDACFSEPLALLMGSEEKGLHYKVLEIVDETIRIQGSGKFDSLNVSVATGILLYEVFRQRQLNSHSV